MPPVEIFAPCRMKVFADLIHDQMGIDIRMRGSTICCDASKNPPTIYLPNLEFAKEDDIKILYGFALHEAGHVKYTDFSALADLENYVQKMFSNYFEDEFIERRIKKDFPGGKEMLRDSHNLGYKMHLKAPKGKFGGVLFETVEESYLNPASIRKFLIGMGERFTHTGLRITDNKLRDFMFSDPEIAALMEKHHNGGLTEDENYRIGFLAIRQRCESLGLAIDDASVLKALEIRLEAGRFLWLWSYVWRNGEKKSIHKQFAEHPYQGIFQKVNAEPTRSTQDCLAQTDDYIMALDVQPILPFDARIVEEAKEKLTDAKEKAALAAAAAAELRKMLREQKQKINEKTKELGELQKSLEANDEASDAKQEANELRLKAEELKKDVKAAEERLKRVRDRLAKERRRMRELRKEADQAQEDAENADKYADGKGLKGEEREQYIQKLKDKAEAKQQALENLEQKIAQDEALLERREAEMGMAEEEAADAESALNDAKARQHKAEEDATEAEKALETAKKGLEKEIVDSYKSVRDPLDQAADETRTNAKIAAEEANKILIVIKEGDAEAEAEIAAGVKEEVEQEVFEKVKNESLEDELGDVEGNVINENGADGVEEGGKVGKVATSAMSARKYIPFDRSYDAVDTIGETPKGCEKYEKAREEYRQIIDDTAERLRKLYSPEKTKLKVNAEQGRIDPRKLVKIGLAMKGVQQDLSKVWRSTQPRKDPKVAVSLLIDCSGSMSGPAIDLARKAACCLSEVMRKLKIPHEIIGHTTKNSGAKYLDFEGESQDDFSRFLPFQGYIFKTFDENVAPASVFSDVEMMENLDGEAVMWAMKRLAIRREKTKICIVLCDGMPNATMSKTDELERHLYTVCKQTEAKEAKDHVYLCSLGIGEERVKAFYKNASILNTLEELPESVLHIVEDVLVNLVGSLG